MRRETVKPRDNRAATPLFRAFGGRLVEPDGEEVVLANRSDMHRLEGRLLGLLMPLMAGLIVFDGLWRLGGAWLAWTSIAPAWLLGLHLLSLGFGRRSPAAAFWCWAVLFSAWSGWMVNDAVPWVRGIAWGWLGFLGLQGAGLAMMGWNLLMRLRGSRGLTVRMVGVVAAHLGMAWAWWRFGWPWGLAWGAGIAAIGCWGTFRPTSPLFGPVATRVRGGGVLITLDDGPDPDDTPALLDLLDRHGVRAVFFVIGDKVREFPELAREIVARGHELGNHTMTHPQASMWCAGPWRMRREIAGCQRAIEEVTGQVPRWFRAPVGHRNFFTHPVAGELELEVVAWSRRAFDTVETDVEKMVRLLSDEAADGDILLLHESTPVAVELLERVLERLSEA